MAKPPGIFCLEGEWDPDLRRRESVLPLLELLERLEIGRAIHRDVATRTEFEYYLGKWFQKRYADYGVLYIASHGDSGELALAGRDRITLAELGEMIDGRADGRMIYFGSCLTLDADDAELTKFVRRAGARAAVGYSEEIEWLDGAAFELLLMERMLRGNRSDAFVRGLQRDHGKFASDLGLLVATKSKVLPAIAP